MIWLCKLIYFAALYGTCELTFSGSSIGCSWESLNLQPISLATLLSAGKSRSELFALFARKLGPHSISSVLSISRLLKFSTHVMMVVHAGDVFCYRV